jgi:hypothetical protein
MLPAMLGLALLSADSWRHLAASRRFGVRLAALVLAGLLFAECLTTPSPMVRVATGPSAALAWLNRQSWPSPALILPVEHERIMEEALWSRQPLANGSNGYFPPGHMTLLRSLSDRFPEPDAVAALRELGIRYVLMNGEQAEKGIGGWSTARLDEALKRATAESLGRRTLGRDHLIDLGPVTFDPIRIERAYDRLTAR